MLIFAVRKACKVWAVWSTITSKPAVAFAYAALLILLLCLVSLMKTALNVARGIDDLLAGTW